MAKDFTEREVQEALAAHASGQPPTLRYLLTLFSSEGLETFGIVDGRGGEEYTVQGRKITTVYEDAPFAHTFHQKPIGDLITFSSIAYLVAARSPQTIPSQDDCAAAFNLDLVLRCRVLDAKERQDRLTKTLGRCAARLREDQDTVHKAKSSHHYLFEQDRLLPGKWQDQKRLEECLSDFGRGCHFRQIASLQSDYEKELESLAVLEADIDAFAQSEKEQQAPLRKRRPLVLQAYEESMRKKEQQRMERQKRASK
jgi:hypothetical protein